MHKIKLEPLPSNKIFSWFIVIVLTLFGIYYSTLYFADPAIFWIIGVIIIIKYFSGVLVSGISINDKKIRLFRTMRNTDIPISTIDSIGIRTINTSNWESPVNEKFLEINTKTGQTYLYPARFGRSEELKEDELKALTGLKLQHLPEMKVLGLQAIKYLSFYLWV